MRKLILSLALALTIFTSVGISSADAQRGWRRGGYYYDSYPTYTYPNYSYNSNYSYYYDPGYTYSQPANYSYYYDPGYTYSQPGYYSYAPGYYSAPTYYNTYPNYGRPYRWGWRR